MASEFYVPAEEWQEKVKIHEVLLEIFEYTKDKRKESVRFGKIMTAADERVGKMPTAADERVGKMAAAEDERGKGSEPGKIQAEGTETYRKDLAELIQFWKNSHSHYTEHTDYYVNSYEVG
ncbi:hypothetical protein L1049_007151 [Liquidambar formosana]|uniref:Uncharacterized protein n=1 Tax=Liquidambar formosana TaxID=63359 RepID=A0AAP0RK53_LIQFO